jgi:hypothetical protein
MNVHCKFGQERKTLYEHFDCKVSKTTNFIICDWQPYKWVI